MEGKGSTAEDCNTASCYRAKVPPLSIVKFLTIFVLEGCGW